MALGQPCGHGCTAGQPCIILSPCFSRGADPQPTVCKGTQGPGCWQGMSRVMGRAPAALATCCQGLALNGGGCCWLWRRRCPSELHRRREKQGEKGLPGLLQVSRQQLTPCLPLGSRGGSEGTSFIRTLKPLPLPWPPLVPLLGGHSVNVPPHTHLLCVGVHRGGTAVPRQSLSSGGSLTLSLPVGSGVQAGYGSTAEGVQPHGQGLAHKESTGLILRGSREDGVSIAFFLLASCQWPSPATPRWPGPELSQTQGLHCFADRVSGPSLVELGPPPLLGYQLPSGHICISNDLADASWGALPAPHIVS